jgi:hypothetical protein
MTAPLALAGGSFVFIGVIVAILIAVTLSYYTRRGLGIGEHPSDGRGEAPGAEGASRISNAGTDEVESTVSSRGTR